MKTKPPEVRFWSKVERRGPGDCWPWRCCEHSRRYGHIDVAGKSVLASRFSFELANGPIPLGLLVLHRCDNPPCVNPAHLFLGTHADNMRDMSRKGRGFRKPLSASVVAAIRVAIATGEDLWSIAARLGLHYNTVWRIAKGRWNPAGAQE